MTSFSWSGCECQASHQDSGVASRSAWNAPTDCKGWKLCASLGRLNGVAQEDRGGVVWLNEFTRCAGPFGVIRCLLQGRQLACKAGVPGCVIRIADGYRPASSISTPRPELNCRRPRSKKQHRGSAAAVASPAYWHWSRYSSSASITTRDSSPLRGGENRCHRGRSNISQA